MTRYYTFDPGYDVGYQDGHADGYTDGFQEASVQYEARYNQLSLELKLLEAQLAVFTNKRS